MNCKKFVLARLREFLHFEEIFGNNWIKNTKTYTNISSKQHHVRNLILIIKDIDKKKKIESLYNIKIFSFTYNGIASKNSNFGYNIKKFQLKQFITAKFSILAINFRSKSKSNNTFNFKILFF